MLHYRLPDHLGICEVDGRILMLDLRRDRYLALDPGASSALRRWRAADGSLTEADVRLLGERGMLVAGARAEPPRWTETRVPEKSLVGQLPRLRSSGWSALPEVAAMLWSTRWRLRRTGLGAVVDEVRRLKSAAGSGDPLPHLLAFRAARMLLPFKPNCLIDSLALAAFLSRRGVGCQLVFGVKLDPFAAHCWLQDDDAVLNDAADSVSTFTPILAV